MSNPPRRSRPKKPATTIDLEAKPVPAVGYPGPISHDAGDDPVSDAASAGASSSGEAALPEGGSLDAESRLADTASPSTSSEQLPHSPDGASTSGDGAPSAAEAFAVEESLSRSGETRRSDLDETILSAAVPDFVASDDAPSEPPAPTFDYNQPSQAPVPESARGGFGPALGGALLGAAIALLGAGALQYAGVLPSVGAGQDAEALAQFARTGDVQQVSTDLSALGAEVEQLRSAQAAGGTGGGASTADLTTVADRVTALEQRGDAGSASSAQSQEAATKAQGTADTAAGAAEAARVAAEAATAASNGALTAADQARQTADTANQGAQAAQQAAQAAQAAAGGAQQSATAANEAIAGFETRLAAIEDGNRRAGIALAAAGLKAAIDRGGPFMSELESFATTAGPSPAVETLRGFAAEGVPSTQALLAEWPGVRAGIASALRPVDPNASVGDQILTGLNALVTSRPVGAGPDAAEEGPSAALGRLSAAIESGNAQGFLDEWAKLPQPAKDVSAAFQAKVDARARTEAVVGETLNNAVNAGAQPAGTAG